MQLNKCSRCGCFFSDSSDVCPNCQPKDMCDVNKLKNFLEDTNCDSSIEEISYETGISAKNLHRLFKSDELINYSFTCVNNNVKTN